VSRAALAADEIIELGQQAPPPAGARTELDQVRGVIDAWLTRYSKDVSHLIARQSNLARNESVLELWARGMAFFVLHPLLWPLLAQMDDKEQWEVTRLVALKLLNESQKFAQRFGYLMTEEQFKVGQMGDQSALAAIDAAEQWARAIRPAFMDVAATFVVEAVRPLVEGAEDLARILKSVVVGVGAAVTLPFDIISWIKDHLGAILVVGGLAAAGITALAVHAALGGGGR
jgi:hypothetical protein